MTRRASYRGLRHRNPDVRHPDLDVVTMSFFSFRVRAPLALVAIIVYVLG
jgi:hypothetical protein